MRVDDTAKRGKLQWHCQVVGMASLGLMFLCSIVRKRVGGRARFGIRVGKSYSVVGVGMAGGGMAAARSAPHRAQQRRHNVAGGGGADRDGICRGEEKHGEPPPNKPATAELVRFEEIG